MILICVACGNPAHHNHHIIFRSQMKKTKWRESPANKFPMCTKCHKFPHGENNPEVDGVRVTGRQWMISTLEKYGTRWSEALAILKRKEGLDA